MVLAKWQLNVNTMWELSVSTIGFCKFWRNRTLCQHLVHRFEFEFVEFCEHLVLVNNYEEAKEYGETSSC